LQKIATRVALATDAVQSRFTRSRPNWIHVRFRRADSD
jgi:hypothetical protein